jgi:hypothetical protein
MKTCVEVYFTIFDLALDEGERLASQSWRFNLGETTPGTLCIDGWVGPRAGLDTDKKKYISPAEIRTKTPQTFSQ